MIFDYTDYRIFLKNVLAEKAKAGEGYSLRAFAEKLGVSNSYFSEVLGDKKSLSLELAYKVAFKLHLTAAETEYFCLLIQLEKEEDPYFREEFSKRLKALNPKRKTHDLSVDLFAIISNWHHYAILELTQLTGFRLSAAAAAKRLSISKSEAEVAIDRLVRLELLIQDAKHGYLKAHQNLMVASSFHNQGIKQFHKQILQKADESVDRQTPQERLSATEVFPVDSKTLAEADRLSLEFFAAIQKLSERAKVKDAVYALSVHFFNLTPRT